METIRRSVFETNSSSTHCLSIQKTSMKLPVSHWNSTDFPLQKVLGNDDLLMHIIEYGRVVFASRDYPDSQGLYDEIWKLPTKNDCIFIVAGD